MFPDEWHDYTQCGNVIKDTNIICFKVPLKSEMFKYITDDNDIWTVEKLIKQIPTLGAVIELNDADKQYYQNEEIKLAGLLYKKINVASRVLPNQNLVNDFIDTMEKFIKKCPGMLIGVHCTHGVNRTGFMVCNYLIRKKGLSPLQAINRFEKARGHEIKRKKYINSLLN
ncbi:ptp [Oxyplax ochracea nucleopolyhedrovirus]|uniref:Ptp n=1 Tax=Oxyplax ochracea nucleopolyhedrovirus TaxID=2083176 RepID=A0A2L0WU89_9ABAC|nr:ptp [Oxyplax ochracea nucleopolyhedrovirus]AVA31221.1 ptp [Oxyplax ochracea nucleopolyhedrovirus]